MFKNFRFTVFNCTVIYEENDQKKIRRDIAATITLDGDLCVDIKFSREKTDDEKKDANDMYLVDVGIPNVLAIFPSSDLNRGRIQGKSEDPIWAMNDSLTLEDITGIVEKKRFPRHFIKSMFK